MDPLAKTASNAALVFSASSVIVLTFLNSLVPLPIVSDCASKPVTRGPTKLTTALFTIPPLGALSNVAILEPPTKNGCEFHDLLSVIDESLIESIVKSASNVAVPPPVTSKYIFNSVESNEP